MDARGRKPLIGILCTEHILSKCLAMKKGQKLYMYHDNSIGALYIRATVSAVSVYMNTRHALETHEIHRSSMAV